MLEIELPQDDFVFTLTNAKEHMGSELVVYKLYDEKGRLVWVDWVEDFPGLLRKAEMDIKECELNNNKVLSNELLAMRNAKTISGFYVKDSFEASVYCMYLIDTDMQRGN